MKTRSDRNLASHAATTRIWVNRPITLVLSAVPLVLYLIDGYAGWLALTIALGGAWGISFAWVRSLANGLTLKRDRRFVSVQVGDPLIEQTEIFNSGSFPALWVELAYTSTLPDFQPSIIAAVGRSGGGWRRTIRAICTRRGLFSIGPVRLEASDPFGLFRVSQFYPLKTTLLVVPPIWRFPELHIPPGGRRGEGTPTARALEQSAAAATVRAYVSGDDLRWIHWRTTARHSELFVRQLEHSPAGDWWIYLDLDRSVQSGSGASATEERAVVLAAFLTDRGLQAGHAVGLLMSGEHMVRIPPSYGQDHYQKIMQALAVAQLGQVPLGQLIQTNRSAAQHNPSLIVITPSTQPTWVDPLAGLMLLGAQPLALLIAPDVDPRLGSEMDSHPAALAQRLSRRGIPQRSFSGADFEPGDPE